MGLDAAVPPHVTNRPAHDARPSSLHRRLTVALASASDRAQLAALIAGDLGAVGSAKGPHLLRSEDLWQAADGFAQEREADRQAERSKRAAVAARATHDFDTARLQLDHLTGRRTALIDGAQWASGLGEELAAREAALAAAAEALDAAQHERRAAQQDIDRVMEQRAAAAAAIEEADRELAEMAGSGMDETALRRELEAAGQAVQQARDAHDEARARLEELQLEATGLRVRREALAPETPAVEADVDVELVRAVHDALGSVQGVRIDGEVDREAASLADAWTAITDDLRTMAAPGAAADGSLAAAERRLAAATEALVAMDEAVAASTLAPADRAALDAAHAELLEAEEAVTRRRVTGSAKRRLEQAQAAERALLDQHGFGSYLDVVLTGGRSVASDPAREQAEREHFEAKLAVEALRRIAPSSPEAIELRAERDRLHRQVTELLGVDPGDAVVPLLRSHRPVSPLLQVELKEALERVGIRPVGISLEAAAESFLSVHPLPDLDAEPIDTSTHGDASRLELAAIEARTVALEAELADAEAQVDRTAEELQMAERSVGAFENELTVRAGEDLSRLQRFAAAEQLRAQIEAVAATLRRAEEAARSTLAEVEQSVTAAEATFDSASADLSDLARRARQLAEELPIDQRPEGEVLGSLDVLCERLRAHADVLQPELDQAEVALAAATRRMDEALDAAQALGPKGAGPIAEDLCDGLAGLLEVEPRDTVLLLDEPFVGVDTDVRGQLLERVRAVSADRQVVLLTADADVLGWAIELPAEEATALPADALLARLRRSNEGLPAATEPTTPGAPTESAKQGQAPDVDITTPALEPMTPTDTPSEPAKTGRRWAGQR